MPGPAFLRGDRVELRRVAREDLPFVQRGRNHPAVRRWMPRVHPQRREAVEDEFEDYMGDAEEGVNLLACPEPETPAGFLSLFDLSNESGRGRLAAWFAPEFHGRGYGTEAVRLLVDYAFQERRLHKLVAGALATNVPSRTVIERTGFEQEGHQSDHYYVEGEYVDRAVYGLRREQWADRR